MTVHAGSMRRSVRALFVSDLHLGTRGAQAEAFLDFLKGIDADTIYLVGDIVDAWRLRRTWFWPQQHNDVVQKLLRRARHGTRIFYLPGNHDEFLRDFPGHHFGGVEVVDRVIHEGLDGRRHLVIHGDQFDLVVRHARWVAHLGDRAYGFALVANGWINLVRRRLGLTYWSLSAWAKGKVKDYVNALSAFENALVEEARRVGADGVICGHIHHAAMRRVGPIDYTNCGDWVESMTAIVETADGHWELIRWSEERDRATSLERTRRPLVGAA